jgi:hypothetical protein
MLFDMGCLNFRLACVHQHARKFGHKCINYMHMFKVGHNGLGGCLEASIYNDFYSLNEVCISSLLEAIMGYGRDRKKRSNIIRFGPAQ